MTMGFRTLTVVVALVVLATGCRTMTGQSLGQNFDNMTTTAMVKSKLTADSLHNLTWVDVDTSDGVVYLTGNAPSAQAKARATEIAMRTDGVRRVSNDIQVVSDATAPRRQGGAANASSRMQQPSSPAASPATVGAAAAGPVSGEVVSVDHGSGNLTLRMTDGNTLQLRLPPDSLGTVRAGDRLSVSVTPIR